MANKNAVLLQTREFCSFSNISGFRTFPEICNGIESPSRITSAVTVILRKILVKDRWPVTTLIRLRNRNFFYFLNNTSAKIFWLML